MFPVFKVTVLKHDGIYWIEQICHWDSYFLLSKNPNIQYLYMGRVKCSTMCIVCHHFGCIEGLNVCLYMHIHAIYTPPIIHNSQEGKRDHWGSKVERKFIFSLHFWYSLKLFYYTQVVSLKVIHARKWKHMWLLTHMHAHLYSAAQGLRDRN